MNATDKAWADLVSAHHGTIAARGRIVCHLDAQRQIGHVVNFTTSKLFRGNLGISQVDQNDWQRWQFTGCQQQLDSIAVPKGASVMKVPFQHVVNLGSVPVGGRILR
ncbi:MAG: hypothetical protein AAGK02_02555 [Pseudomonadota bacterium]